ncbi:MAG: diacylglycerol kinase family protein [Bdellovibrionia bacterium]
MSNAESVSVVVNPWSRGGRGILDWLLSIEPALSEIFPQGFRSYIPMTAERADLARWLREELESGKRRFIACGGDGTLNLTLNELAAISRELGIDTRELKLGAVGMGSSNDFHKSLNSKPKLIAGRFPARIDFEETRLNDLPFFEDASGPVYFLINLSVGLTAYANHSFNNPGRILGFLKRTSTDLAIAGAALRTAVEYKNVPMKISWNGGAQFECDVVNLSFIKKNHFAGSFFYREAPAANDGKLGFYGYSNMGRLKTLGQMAHLTRGNFQPGPGRFKDFISEAELEADSNFLLEADGEVHSVSRAKIGVVPESIGLCP